MIDGTMPAFAEWIGVGKAPEGSGANCAMSPGEKALGRPGVLHGGATATLLEQSGRLAVITALGLDQAIIEIASITVDYLRVGRDAPALAGATIVKLGGRVAVVSATAWTDDRNKPFAAAKMTFILDRADDAASQGSSMADRK